MKGIFYGLGVGPGDPDLLTVKAHKILQSADVIITPTKKMGKPSIAYRIVESHITDRTRVVEMSFPMISLSAERETLEKQWKENADEIEKILEEGKSVVFLTLSGVPSFCNLAAQINVPLTQGEESLGIVAMTQPIEEVQQILDAHRNIVIMKVSADNKRLAEELEKRGLENSFVLVSNIGMENQSMIRDIEVLKGDIPYLSTLLIKKDYDITL